MAYGLKLFNGDNDVLIDSDFEHYHFAGIAALSGGAQSIPPYVGGNNTNHSTTLGQTISPNQVVGKVQKHILASRSGYGSPPPMCFLKPAGLSGFYSTQNNLEIGTHTSSSVILTRRIPNTSNWEIWTLTATTGDGVSSIPTGGSNTPRLYCFLPLRFMTAAAEATASGDDYGLATFNSAGVKTYDSRKLPLKITATIPVSTPPARARSIITGTSSYSPNFTPNSKNYHQFTAPSDWNASNLSQNNSLTDLMYFCPSVCHSVQDTKAFTDGEGFQASGYNSTFYAWARSDLWWMFSRNTFSIVKQNDNSYQGFVLKSMYTGYGAGHVWKSEENSSSFLAVVASIALSLATFGASLVTVAVAVTATALASTFNNYIFDEGNYYPYADGNKNLTEAGPMLLSRPSFYD